MGGGSFNLTVKKLESMSYAKKFSDELSFSFRGNTQRCAELIQGNGSNLWSLDKKGMLRVSPADIFYSPCFEKHSRTSQDGVIDYPEIRFCEKTSHIEIPNEKRAQSVGEASIGEAPFDGEFDLPSPHRELSHSSKPLFSEAESLLPTLTEKSDFQEDSGSNLHYTLSEDYFILFRSAEYQRNTPRIISKEHFILCLQPALGRTKKSISKRMDRLRALSHSQRSFMLLYVRKFPSKTPFRKAVFDSNGESLSIKTLTNKPLPEIEAQFIESVCQNRFSEAMPSCSFLEAKQLSLAPDTTLAEASRNFTFADQLPFFCDVASTSEKEAEKSFWSNFVEEMEATTRTKLEKKVRVMASKHQGGSIKVRDPTVVTHILDFMRWSFKLDPVETLKQLSSDQCQNFEEIRRAFLVALPQKRDL